MKAKKILTILLTTIAISIIIIMSLNINKINKIENSNNEKNIINITKTFNITKGGKYNLTGQIEDGHIYINSNEAVYIVLNNLNIKNTSGPAIIIENAPATTIILNENSVNTLEDGETYKDVNLDGCINSQDDLLIKGNGKLIINSNKRGISAKDKLIIDGGNYQINSKEEGIKANDVFDFLDGNLEIKSELEGIKVSNKKNTNIGDFKIENGNIKIDSVDKGISTRSKIIINNGEININSKRTGIKSKNVEINNGKINILALENGIVASGTKVFNSLENKYYHKNDAFLTINNGKIIIDSGKDGVKINGKGNMNEGYLEIYTNYGLKSSCIDQDIEFNINGGTLLAFGYNNKIKIPNQTSKQKTYIYKSEKTNNSKELKIKDINNVNIINTTIKKPYQYIIISDKNIKNLEETIIQIDNQKIENEKIKINK